MITLDIYPKDPTKILITSDYPMRDRELLKSLPGSRYDLREHVWLAPKTWATCQAMRGMFGGELDVKPAVVEWANEKYLADVEPALMMRNSLTLDVEANSGVQFRSERAHDETRAIKAQRGGDLRLYPYQESGVLFLTHVERAMLLDEMGTGKTIQTIRALMCAYQTGGNPFPAIIVAPNNMTLTWKKEIDTWWPGLKVVVVKGSAMQRRKIIKEPAHIYIINFESVRLHSRLKHFPGSPRLNRCEKCDKTASQAVAPAKCEMHPREFNEIKWKSVVVDEAHRMKNPQAKQTMAINALVTPSTSFVYCLTGTPIGNSPVDLWPALHLIDAEQFPSKTAYVDRYCLLSYNLFGGMEVVGLNPQTKDEFFRVVDPLTRRMPKAAVLKFLPEKVYSTRYVEMSAKQRTAYEQMDKNQIAILGTDYVGITVAANPLTELTRLTQFASAFAGVDEFGQVKLSAPSNKIDALLEILDESGDEPAVVFAQSRQLIELAAVALEKAGITYSMIVGGQSPDEREAAKTSFQDGGVRVVLCTIAAGGIGITLTRSQRAIFLQRSWSNIENKQAEDRVHRIGSQIHPHIDIIDIVSVGTIEENQRRVLAGKEEVLQEVVRDADTVARTSDEPREVF